MDFRDISEFIKDSAKYILVIVLVLVIVIYVASLQQVVGPSMSKTLSNKDIILIDKLSYRFSEPKRFDVISFEYAETKYLIKRIIGMPGEHIKYVDNVLYVNDVEYGDKNSLNEITDDFDIKKLGFDVIPDDMYLVIGDNRTNSLDGRSKKVGLIKKEDIIGKAIVRIWPLNGIKVIK